jgi:FkbM family methyltransferase
MDITELTRVTDATAAVWELAGNLRTFIRHMYPPCTHPGGQDGETEIIDGLLQGGGMYVDVGANHPQNLSNTWGLYQRGWRGLLIDPLPWSIPALAKHRPGDFVYPVAAMDHNGMVQLRMAGPLSSIRPEWNIDEQGRLLVECETMETILSHFPAVRDACRLCSIDVEGSEREVLLGINWTTFHPEVLCIEYRDYDPYKLGADLSDQWDNIVVAQGYREVQRTKFNIIYQRAAQ